MIEGTLKSGTELIGRKGTKYHVEKLLGSGGQGEVYQISSPTERKALKWYYPETSTTEQKNTIGNLVEAGSPSSKFLWPEDLIISDSNKTFGYVMNLRPDSYKSIPDLLNRKVNITFPIMLKIIYNLANEYDFLHSKGFSYKDISDKNVFFNPNDGDVLICDNDNVSINGQNDSGVYGTMRYMAPEIVRGEASPSRNTDLYSLAVLIFSIMYISHPLEGKNEASIHALDDAANKKLFGTNPIYIFDPKNPENRPVKGIHDNAIIYDEIYPTALKKLFEEAFTKGINNPGARITERQWKDMSLQLMDSIVQCPKCNAPIFYDIETEEQTKCWHCHESIQQPTVITIGRKKLVLNSNTKIKEHYIELNYEINKNCASVVQNPKNPTMWGIRNDSNETWTYIRADGTQAMLPPGKTAAISKGAKIKFGKVDCEM